MDAPECQGCRELRAKVAELEAKLQAAMELIAELMRKLQDVPYRALVAFLGRRLPNWRLIEA